MGLQHYSDMGQVGIIGGCQAYLFSTAYATEHLLGCLQYNYIQWNR